MNFFTIKKYPTNKAIITIINITSSNLIKGKYVISNFLSLIKANSSIPLITKVPRFTNNPLLKFDLQATACYSLLNDKVNPFNDYLQSPIIKY